MFNIFKTDPKKTLEKQVAQKLEQARDAQRSGDMPLFATLSAEAEAIGKKLDALE